MIVVTGATGHIGNVLIRELIANGQTVRALVLSDDDLDREIDEPQYQSLPTVGVRLISVLANNLQHAGQVAYLRGLLHGIGWQRR